MDAQPGPHDIISGNLVYDNAQLVPTDGIGAITDARMANFFDKMVRAGGVKPTVDFRKSYSLQFVNKMVGLELRPKN